MRLILNSSSFVSRRLFVVTLFFGAYSFYCLFLLEGSSEDGHLPVVSFSYLRDPKLDTLFLLLLLEGSSVRSCSKDTLGPDSQNWCLHYNTVSTLDTQRLGFHSSLGSRRRTMDTLKLFKVVTKHGVKTVDNLPVLVSRTESQQHLIMYIS